MSSLCFAIFKPHAMWLSMELIAAQIGLDLETVETLLQAPAPPRKRKGRRTRQNAGAIVSTPVNLFSDRPKCLSSYLDFVFLDAEDRQSLVLHHHHPTDDYITIVDCLRNREPGIYYEMAWYEASLVYGQYAYVLENFVYDSTKTTFRHPQVLLSFPWDRLPSNPHVPICCTFPARRPMSWNGNQPVQIPSMDENMHYRFADTPFHIVDHTDMEMMLLGLQLDARAWAREKRLWKRIFRKLPEEVIRWIESWLEQGFSNGRFCMI